MDVNGLKIVPLLEGKPFMTEFGIVGYSTVVLLYNDTISVVYDCGPKGCALQLKEALAEYGFKPEDIDYVVMSHLHFDHTGNLPLFKNARILMNEREWKSACENPDEWQCVMTVSYIKERGNYAFVSEGYKITDEAVIIELPGHTPGLIGIKCGNIIMCSDALKNRYEMWEDIPLMSVDPKKSRASIERIKKEASFIFPGHDCMLDVLKPINKESVSFNIRFANGRILKV